jgi:hypothetical protein
LKKATHSIVCYIRKPGANKPNNNPYTICIIANPFYESPTNSGSLFVDPISHSEQLFNSKVSYILSALFGQLPNQAETMLLPVSHEFRVISIFDDELQSADENALVSEQDDLVVARQLNFATFLATYQAGSQQQLKADVAFAVTAANNSRSSAWYTQDNDAGGGIPFVYEGRTLHHRFENIHPGTIALHTSAVSLVALHEFGHAASSFTNGMILDLYLDNIPAINVKRGRPIPVQFASYSQTNFACDPVRDGLGYEPGWTSYHCQLINAHAPAVMDNFWYGTPPEQCVHDAITRRFLMDRVNAIMSRP